MTMGSLGYQVVAVLCVWSAKDFCDRISGARPSGQHGTFGRDLGVRDGLDPGFSLSSVR